MALCESVSWGSSVPIMNCAKHDAELTHPNTICLQANAFFAMAIAHAIRTAVEPAYRFSHK